MITSEVHNIQGSSSTGAPGRQCPEPHTIQLQEIQESAAEASQWLNLNGPENPIALPVMQLLAATKMSTRCVHNQRVTCLHDVDLFGMLCFTETAEKHSYIWVIVWIAGE